MQECNNNKRQEAGIYFVLSAVIITMLIGIVALAVDIGTLYRDHLTLKKAAESAVAAGLAYEAYNRDDLDEHVRDDLIKAVVKANAGTLQLDLENNPNEFVRISDNHLVHDDPDLDKKTDDGDGEGLKLIHPNGKEIADDAGVLPEQGLGVALNYKPKLFFSVLKNMVNARSNAFAVGSLKPANVALVLDFSGSMCCSGNTNCGINACAAPSVASGSGFAEPYADDSKAKSLIEAVANFLKHFRNNHDHISLTLFSTVAETVNPMTQEHSGQGPIDSSWYPEDLNQNNIGQNNSIWARLSFDHDAGRAFTGNTNPSDALLRAFTDTLEGYRIDTTDPKNVGPVHYVFFTDGAPTAGRLIIPSNDVTRSPTGQVAQLDRMNSLPNAANLTPNIYNPYELPFYRSITDFKPIGVGLLYNHKYENIGDYYSYKVMHVWSMNTVVDSNGKTRSIPANYQFTPSPLIRTAIYAGNADAGDDGDISVKLPEFGGDFERSIYFGDFERPQFGSRLEAKKIAGEWSGFVWDDRFFKFLPECSYGGKNMQTLENGEDYEPPSALPAEHVPGPGEYGYEEDDGKHQQSNYRKYFEAANHGLCCAENGTRLHYQSEEDLEISKIDGALDQDLCQMSAPYNQDCQESYSDDSADGRDRVWERQSRCYTPTSNPAQLLPGGGGAAVGNRMWFAVPFTDKTYENHYGTDNWAQVYYDAAIEYADMIRANNGIIYAIGLGQNNNIRNDFYQGVHNDFARHDFFLTRLALDPHVCELSENIPDSELGCGLKNDGCVMKDTVRSQCVDFYQRNAPYTNNYHWNKWGVDLKHDANGKWSLNFNLQDENLYDHRYDYGEYLPTDDPALLSDLFQQVAKKILISLTR